MTTETVPWPELPRFTDVTTYGNDGETHFQYMVERWAEALRIVATQKLGRHSDATAVADAVRAYLVRIVEQETGEDPRIERELAAAAIIGSTLQAVTYMRFRQFDKARNVMSLVSSMVNDMLAHTDPT